MDALAILTTLADAPLIAEAETTRLAFLAALTIFVLGIFVGFEIITKIPPTLHTPLMSGSNAISGITLVGAIHAVGLGATQLATVLGTLAVVLATINVVGGFLVTNRMLSMFRRKAR
jgi:NAD(P) transhydrogenase subunit alpha